MRPETTRIFKDLMFLHGHVADPRLGVELATDGQATATPDPASEGSSMNLFKSLWLLGGLQSIDLRVGEEDEAPFGQTYGNRRASERTFGRRDDAARVLPATQAKRPTATPKVAAHC